MMEPTAAIYTHGSAGNEEKELSIGAQLAKMQEYAARNQVGDFCQPGVPHWWQQCLSEAITRDCTWHPGNSTLHAREVARAQQRKKVG